MSSGRTVLCIVGPTASGKTSLSVALAKRLHGEIVSADAVAVYKGLDIGSAKPTEAEREGVRHYMIDCADIKDNSFTVSVFRKMARDAIDSILLKGVLPIVVGGSGLYLDAIFSDMAFSAPSDPAIRLAIETDYARDKNAVYSRLQRVDPITAARLHPNDQKRIVRALEVFEISNTPFSELNRSFQSAQAGDGTYRIMRIGLWMDRAHLYERIEQRVDRMIENGLPAEAYALFEQGLTPDRYTAMQAIGYAQLYEAYCGHCSVEDAVEEIKKATRHFAKRQMTWFRRNAETLWFDAEYTSVEDILNEITENLYEDR